MIMTGRDLIVYIIENKLEDQPVFDNGELLGFVSVAEAAERCGVGIGTVCVWISQGLIYGIKVNGEIYVPANFKSPMEE